MATTTKRDMPSVRQAIVYHSLFYTLYFQYPTPPLETPTTSNRAEGYFGAPVTVLYNRDAARIPCLQAGRVIVWLVLRRVDYTSRHARFASLRTEGRSETGISLFF